MSLNSVKDEWDSFAALVFKNCKPSEIQVREMRKSFFAGAYAIVSAVQEIGEPHITEQEGMAYLTAVNDECQSFAKDVMREYIEGN